MELFASVLTPQTIGIAAGIIAVLAATRKAAPELRKRGWWRRLLPFLPIALGIGAAFALRLFSEEMAPEDCLTSGLVAGFLAAHGRKVFKQSIKGQFKEDA